MNKIKVGDNVQVVAEEGIGKFKLGEKLTVTKLDLDYCKVINMNEHILNYIDYLHVSKLIKL